MAFTNSYTTALNKHKNLAIDHNKTVIEWKAEVEDYATKILSEKSDTISSEIRQQLKKKKTVEYQIVGDNLDFEQTVRHQNRDNKNKSVHWFHYMAVKERVHSFQGFYLL